MILMTIEPVSFSLFKQPETKKEQLRLGMVFHGVCDGCSTLFRKNKNILCDNRVADKTSPRSQAFWGFRVSGPGCMCFVGGPEIPDS